MDSSRRYTGIAVVNHWITALLVITMLALGLAAGSAPGEEAEDYIIGLHIGVGFFTFLFVLWRVAYRLKQGFPPPLEGAPLEIGVMKSVHWLLLAALTLQALTGPLYLFTEGEGMDVFGVFTFYVPLESLSAVHGPVEEIHVITGTYLMPFLLLMHILGGIRHFLRTEPRTRNG